MRKYISVVLLVLLVALAPLTSGCGLLNRGPQAPHGLGSKTFTTEELSQLALEAVAYIETPFAQGSGFAISADGLIVTNFHVMQGADTATVTIGGKTYNNVTVVASSHEYDLAILSIPAQDLVWLPLARNTNATSVGEQVLAMGNPQGLQGTVSDGIISAMDRQLDGITFGLIQTSAPVSPGSSGGPLLNMKGEVIGVNALSYLAGQNLNFAIPVELVHQVRAEITDPQQLSQVFGSQSGSRYQHQDGQFAISLTWQGDVDMDLEIWDEEFNYIGDASVLGDCWDIVHGDQGEEYFVFKVHPETNLSRQHDLPRDFSTGRFIVSPYYYDGHGDDVTVTLTIHYPDGSSEELFGDVSYTPPYDQWFALLVDADEASVKLLDFFPASQTIALLEWDTEADLDLIVWDYDYGEYFFPFEFGGNDITDGTRGLEVFLFHDFGVYDFSHGLMDVDVVMHDSGNPTTKATVTLFHNGEVIERFSHTFTPDPRGDYIWQVIESLNPETGEFTEPEEERLFD